MTLVLFLLATLQCLMRLTLHDEHSPYYPIPDVCPILRYTRSLVVPDQHRNTLLQS